MVFLKTLCEDSDTPDPDPSGLLGATALDHLWHLSHAPLPAEFLTIGHQGAADGSTILNDIECIGNSWEPWKYPNSKLLFHSRIRRQKSKHSLQKRICWVWIEIDEIWWDSFVIFSWWPLVNVSLIYLAIWWLERKQLQHVPTSNWVGSHCGQDIHPAESAFSFLAAWYTAFGFLRPFFIIAKFVVMCHVMRCKEIMDNAHVCHEMRVQYVQRL